MRLLSSTKILVVEISGAENKNDKTKWSNKICIIYVENSNYIAYFRHITRLLTFYS